MALTKHLWKACLHRKLLRPATITASTFGLKISDEMSISARGETEKPYKP